MQTVSAKFHDGGSFDKESIPPFVERTTKYYLLFDHPRSVPDRADSYMELLQIVELVAINVGTKVTKVISLEGNTQMYAQ